MFKELVLKFLLFPRVSSTFIRCVLRMHNISYQLAGILSKNLEPDGIHPKHRLMKYHDWFTEKMKGDWDILDIGCGNGALTYDLKSVCNSVTGIDIEKRNIEYAQKNFFKKGITYICADAVKFEFKTPFNALVLSNVLEHIEDRIGFLKRIYDNQPAGLPPVLFLRVPMITRDWITMYKKEKGVEWRLDTSHFTEYSIEQVHEELNEAGLYIESYDIQFGEFYGVVKIKNGQTQ